MSDKHVIREKLLVLDIPEQPLGTYLVVVTNGDGDIMYREQPDVIVDLGLQPASTITIQVMSEWNAAYNNMIIGASFSPATGDLTLTQQDTGTIVANLDGRYLQSETDPVFLASAAAGIISNDLIFWNYAYNKAITGVSFNTSNGVLSFSQVDSTGLSVDLDGRYLQSETDPIFSASPAGGITAADILGWESGRTQTFKCDVTDGVASVGNSYTFRIPYAFKITEIRASATKAPVGQNLTIRLYYNGSNLTDPARPLTIDDGDRTSTTSANNYVLLTTDLSDDDEIKVEITQVGTSSAGDEIKFYMIGIRNT